MRELPEFDAGLGYFGIDEGSFQLDKGSLDNTNAASQPSSLPEQG